jgi:hypothetical protein
MDLDHLTQGVALGYGGLGLSAQRKFFSTATFRFHDLTGQSHSLGHSSFRKPVPRNIDVGFIEFRD